MTPARAWGHDVSMSAMDLRTGVNDAMAFGKYRLIASLGHGGMADVFLAVAQGPVGFNKLQVIKRLRPNLAEEAEFLAMFLDEARLAARLNHPNIVQTNEVGEVAGQYFIAMEYLDGQPLHRILHRGGKSGTLTRAMGIKILADTLAGLHAAHELTDYDGTPLRVVHRDASPHNVFVTYEGQTKLVDFGIAKAATRSAETRTGVLKGKIGYMAPEQARCEQVDRRADVFSIGVILWETLSGARMWRSMADVEILDQLMRGRVPDVTTVRPDLAPELIHIVRRSLAPYPDDRYPTAAEMRQDLVSQLAREGARVADEDVGQVVVALFQDKRQQLKSILETQLSSLRTGQHEAVRMVDLPGASMSLPRITSGLSEPTPSVTLNPAPHSMALSQSPVALAPPPPRRSPWVIVGAAAAAAAVVGAILLVGRGNGGSAQSAAPDSAPAAPASGPAVVPAAPAVATIELKVDVQPADATVYLDDAKLSAPYTMKAPADGFGHKLRVEAPGFETDSRMVVFDKDVHVEVKLAATKTAEPAAASPPVRGPRPAPAATTTSDDAFSQPIKPVKKQLDDDDPWKK